ncbi:MAG: prepilin-type N-terminal cleavage/methylation domain-containing protein [Candidatus Riflebacteria bacterium]|nr:prepilin-type N-terminal cleavage/methylation domain-containing protein [Candidatus Riflebacteria bacterium]
MILKTVTINKRHGFSLIEILISLFVLAGSLSVIFSGFEVSAKLNSHAGFESEAAFLAEREIELTKSELLNGNLKAEKVRKIPCRFRLKPGWKLTTLLTTQAPEDTIRLQVRVTHSDRELQLESFLFLPNLEVKNNG